MTAILHTWNTKRGPLKVRARLFFHRVPAAFLFIRAARGKTRGQSNYLSFSDFLREWRGVGLEIRVTFEEGIASQCPRQCPLFLPSWYQLLLFPLTVRRNANMTASPPLRSED